MKLMIGAVTAMLVCTVGGCSPYPTSNSHNAIDPAANDGLAAEDTAAAETTNDDVGLGYDPVQQDQAKSFGAWVVQVPGAIWGAAVSAEERQRYAVTQGDASNALLAFEQADDRYSRARGIVLAANVCHLRDDIWAMKASERLGVSQRADRSLRNTRKALSPIEVDTADAFSSYIAITHAQFMTGSGPTPDCGSLTNMPFLVTLDQFVGGEITELPRPPG